VTFQYHSASMRSRFMGGLLACAAVLLAAVLSACAAPGGAWSPGSTAAASAGRAVLPDSAEESEVRRRARIRVELAANYYQQGNYTVALQELRQAVGIDASYAVAHGMLGLVYMDLGDCAQADSSFRQGLALVPEDSDLNNNYGWFLCQSDRPRESIEYFLRAVKNPLYPTPARPYHNAGICALRAGDEQTGEEYLLRSFQIDLSNAVAMYNLGEFYLARKNVERAQLFADRLVKSYEPTAQTLWLALRVERLAGNRDAEASLAVQLKRRFPTSLEAARLARGQYQN
jgi:type IV pilus assembly protein PilF